MRLLPLTPEHIAEIYAEAGALTRSETLSGDHEAIRHALYPHLIDEMLVRLGGPGTLRGALEEARELADQELADQPDLLGSIAHRLDLIEALLPEEDDAPVKPNRDSERE